MSAHTHFTQANNQYITNFSDKGGLPLPPAKNLTVGMWIISLPRVSVVDNDGQ